LTEEIRVKGQGAGLQRLFVTNTSHMGITGNTVQDNDCIYVLLGSDVPHVLRRQQNASYTYQGEAYVHGIMYGEALTAARSRKYPDLDEEDDKWLDNLMDGKMPFDTEFVHIR